MGALGHRTRRLRPLLLRLPAGKADYRGDPDGVYRVHRDPRGSASDQGRGGGADGGGIQAGESRGAPPGEPASAFGRQPGRPDPERRPRPRRPHRQIGLTMFPDPIRAVVFDAVGTVLVPDPPAADVYVESARRFGVAVTPSEVRARFTNALAVEDVIDRAAGWVTSEDRERVRWQQIVTAVLPG